MKPKDAIAVIDVGGQYAHLIATKVRRLNVLAEILQPDDPVERFREYKGVIISGSPALISQGEEPYNKAIFDLDIPIVGFCFGHQEIAKHYGGEVVHGGQEWGRTDLRITASHPLFAGLGPVEQVWMSHFDSVASVGPGFQEIAQSSAGGDKAPHRYAAIASDRHRRYGFQFHPEVDDTVHGQEIISNFVLRIAGCQPTWTMGRYLDDQLENIRRQVGDRSVFLLASGGVDSTVAAKLFGMAIGSDRLHLLHVDNGLMRKNESRNVLALFESLGLDRNLHFVDAGALFLDRLQGVTEPEKKREIIGNCFIEVFEAEAARLGLENHLLGQGTIYPDTIETGGTKRSTVIKTHHNRVPIIDQMIRAGKVVEPIKELYKEEVRELGAHIGIPREACWRHPFPGPGLGVRLLCSGGEAPSDDVDRITREARAIAATEGLEALALPVRSVGVKADVRSYERPVLLSGFAGWEALLRVSDAIQRQVAGVNRCIWNLVPGAPRLARSLAATVTRDRLYQLREADYAMMQGLRRHGIYDEIWQCPTVFVPLELDGKGSELVVLRPIYSKRAMTASPADLPAQLVEELRAEILRLPGVSGLALDITSKPPGTIEWE